MENCAVELVDHECQLKLVLGKQCSVDQDFVELGICDVVYLVVDTNFS